MTVRYTSPPTNLRSLRDRLIQAAKREGVLFGRLQQHVAVLIVAQFMTALTDKWSEPLLLVKGGTSLELRRGIEGSRTSKDLDAVMRAGIESVHERLADAGAAEWEGFTAVFTPPVPFEVAGQMASLHRFTAKLRYEGKPFASVPIELSAVEAGSAERHDKIVSTALTLVGLPESDAVPCMTLPWQVAQKVHACTDGPEPLRTNDRASPFSRRARSIPGRLGSWHIHTGVRSTCALWRGWKNSASRRPLRRRWSEFKLLQIGSTAGQTRESASSKSPCPSNSSAARSVA